MKTFNSSETLQNIVDVQQQIIMVPFYGTMVPVKVRKLSEAQITACGNISLIKTFEDKVAQLNVKHNMKEIVAYCDRMHELTKRALVAPTYEQIMEQFAHDKHILEAKKQLDELKAELKKTPNGLKRRALEEEIDNTRLWYDLILPNDFMGTIISWTLGIDTSDIEELSRNVLLEAAVLAERCHNAPSDHIQGAFTPFMVKDINRRALQILDDERKKRGGR